MQCSRMLERQQWSYIDNTTVSAGSTPCRGFANAHAETVACRAQKYDYAFDPDRTASIYKPNNPAYTISKQTGITSNEIWRAKTPIRPGITAVPNPVAAICMPIVLAAKCAPTRWLVPDIIAGKMGGDGKADQSYCE